MSSHPRANTRSTQAPRARARPDPGRATRRDRVTGPTQFPQLGRGAARGHTVRALAAPRRSLARIAGSTLLGRAVGPRRSALAPDDVARAPRRLPDDDDRSAPDRTSSTTTTTSPSTRPPAGRPRSPSPAPRSGFAHGYELVRRESPADVEADLDLMASDRRARGCGSASRGARSSRSPGVVRLGRHRPGRARRARGAGCRWSPRSAPRRAGTRRRVAHATSARRGDPGAVRRRSCASRRSATRRSASTTGRSGTSRTTCRSGDRVPDPVAYTELLRQSSTAIHAVDPQRDRHERRPLPRARRRRRDLAAHVPAPRLRARRRRRTSTRSRTTRTSTRTARPRPRPRTRSSRPQAIHDLMVEFGDGAKQIWGTEVGAPTRGPRSVSEDEPGGLAARVLRRVERLGVHRPAALVRGARHRRRGDVEDSYGLVHQDRTPKPALARVRGHGADAARMPPTPSPAAPVAPISPRAGSGPARCRPRRSGRVSLSSSTSSRQRPTPARPGRRASASTSSVRSTVRFRRASVRCGSNVMRSRRSMKSRVAAATVGVQVDQRVAAVDAEPEHLRLLRRSGTRPRRAPAMRAGCDGGGRGADRRRATASTSSTRP